MTQRVVLACSGGLDTSVAIGVLRAEAMRMPVRRCGARGARGRVPVEACRWRGAGIMIVEDCEYG